MTSSTMPPKHHDLALAGQRRAHVAGSWAMFAALFALSTTAVAEPVQPAAAPSDAATATPAAPPPAAQPGGSPATSASEGESSAAPAAPPNGETVTSPGAAPIAPRTTSAAAPPSATTDSVGASPLPNRDDVGRDLVAPPGVLAPLSWDEESGQGVSLGYESGLWGSWWQQGLRVGLPLHRHFALHARAVYVSDTSIEDDASYTADLGGRLDVIGRSRALFNVLRLYGGGGVQVFEPVFATEGRSTQIGGGGHFGFEFFHNPHYSFFLEVGGQGGKPSPGATILAGMAFYPWTE